MLSYSFPEQHRAARASLRRELAWLGYGVLSPGLWICPWDLGSRRDVVLTKHDVARSMFSFTSSLDGDDRQLAAQAYDLVELTAVHQRFLDRYEDAEPHPNGGAQHSDGAALAARVRLVHEWRRFLFLDPGLPDELLPHDWIGDRAAATFLRHYRSVDAAAWREWQVLYASSDPDGDVPPPVASNLDVAAAGGTAGNNNAAGIDGTSSNNSAAGNGSRPETHEPTSTVVVGSVHAFGPAKGVHHD